MESRNTSTADRRVVAWSKKCEWESVYRELYSNDVTRQSHAVGRICVWKSRVLHKLSASIECTCSLIQAVIEDQNAIKSDQLAEKDIAIRMGYALALVRFVNLITEKLQTKSFVQSVHRLANTLGVPEWMVNLRHEATHGSLPQLCVLRTGAQFALGWLKREYWEAQNEWNDTEQTSSSELPTKRRAQGDVIEDLLVTYMQLQFKVMDNPGDINKKDQRAIDHNMRGIDTQLSNNCAEFLSCLLQDGYMIPTQEQLEALDINLEDLLNSKSLSLPSPLVQFWKPILHKISSFRQIDAFLREILDVISDVGFARQRIFYCWIATILEAVSTSREKKLNEEGIVLDDSDSINWQPVFDYCIEHPSHITQWLMPLVLWYLKPTLSKEQQASVLKLTVLAIGEFEENIETYGEEISTYALEDLKKALGKKISTQSTGDAELGKTALISETAWELCMEPVDWSQYPLGECPGIPLDYTNMEIADNCLSEDKLNGYQEEGADSWEKVEHSTQNNWSEDIFHNIVNDVDIL